MNQNKIVPCIWLAADNGTLAHVIEYYKTIFDNNFQAGAILSLGETPGGYTELCEVHIFEQKYTLMSTQNQHHTLNDAISFIIHCDNQNEIDKFWDYFTQHGQESQCGWCIDKYNLRWQIIPKNLPELMNKPNAFAIMMTQTKIIIKQFEESGNY